MFGRKMPIRFWVLSALCPLLPDLDVIADGRFFGHRGFFHSPFFALCCSFILLCIFMREIKLFSKPWWKYWIYFSVLMASHGMLDAFTNGGVGIAFLSPFSNTRYFSPWTPIEVSAIGGISVLFTRRGMRILLNEFLLIWFPLSIVLLLSIIIRHVKQKNVKSESAGR